MIEGTSHWLQMTKPDVFSRILADFIDQLDAGSAQQPTWHCAAHLRGPSQGILTGGGCVSVRRLIVSSRITCATILRGVGQAHEFFRNRRPFGKSSMLVQP